ncbi:MAG: Ger(x)C family spore germination C-terminal domain-containing protein [Clostridia bacterium]
MHTFKRLGLLLLISAVALIAASLFKYSSLSDRIIVLGIGIDYDDKLGYMVSYEAAVPAANNAGDSSAKSGGGKIVKGYGKTLSLALYDANERSGRMVSLGQCSIIILGEKYFTNYNISHSVSYFALSDAFKDGTTVAACKGNAGELLSVQVPLDSYVGLLLQHTIQASGEKINIPKVNISDFVKAQASEGHSCFLPLIEFVQNETPGSKNDEQSDKPSGHYEFNSIALFKDGELLTIANKEQKNTLMMLKEDKSYHTFQITDYSANSIFPRTVAVGTMSKKVKIDYLLEDSPIINIKIKVKIKRLRTDTDGEIFDFVAKSDSEITQKNSIDVQNQITKSVQDLYSFIAENNCDILKIYSSFYKNYGNQWLQYTGLNTDWIKKIMVNVTTVAI